MTSMHDQTQGTTSVLPSTGVTSPSVMRLSGATSSRIYEFSKNNYKEGGAKLVFLTTDEQYAIARYKPKNMRESGHLLRYGLENALSFRESIVHDSDVNARSYWERLFVLPEEKLVTSSKTLAFAMRAIPNEFRWDENDLVDPHGDHPSMPGGEKKVSIVSNIRLRQNVRPSALGTFRELVDACVHVSRGIRKFNLLGRSYGDISLTNVLVNPVDGTALFIDLDNISTNRSHNRAMGGTPGFRAPELWLDGETPTSDSDDFSLAILLYKMLLLRHPFLDNPMQAESHFEKLPTSKLVYIESASDSINRYTLADVVRQLEEDQCEELESFAFPWWDLDALPAEKAVGRPLAKLFRQAFEDGFRNPGERPSALDWERALLRLESRLIKCPSPSCPAKWFPLAQGNLTTSSNLVCPFCGAILNSPWMALSVLENGNDKGWRIVITKDGPVFFSAWQLRIDQEYGEYLEHERLKSSVAEIRYQGECWMLKNKSNEAMTIIPARESEVRQLLMPGQSRLLSADDAFHLGMTLDPMTRLFRVWRMKA